MAVPNFMSKAFCYWDLRGGDLPQGMIRQKYPGADRFKNGNYNTVK